VLLLTFSVLVQAFEKNEYSFRRFYSYVSYATFGGLLYGYYKFKGGRAGIFYEAIKSNKLLPASILLTWGTAIYWNLQLQLAQHLFISQDINQAY
jgi:hypothetical protein